MQAVAETYPYNPDAAGIDHGVDQAYLARIERGLRRVLGRGDGRRLLDLGCGEGSMADWFRGQGFEVTGIDLSPSGIGAARRRFPEIKFQVGDICSPLAVGKFDVVVCLSVLEHVYSPRKLIDTALSVTEPSGLFLCCVPFHGYWKNLAIALLGRFDRHVDPLWDHGHIKFFSERTLRTLLTERGFVVDRMVRLGRAAVIAKELIAVCRPHH